MEVTLQMAKKKKKKELIMWILCCGEEQSSQEQGSAHQSWRAAHGPGVTSPSPALRAGTALPAPCRGLEPGCISWATAGCFPLFAGIKAACTGSLHSIFLLISSRKQLGAGESDNQTIRQGNAQSSWLETRLLSRALCILA